MILLPLLLLPTAHALTVEVSPGDDLATITSSLDAGDEVVFTDGVYALESSLSWTGQGTADAPIRLVAAEGASPVLELVRNADGAWGSSAIVTLQDAAFFEVVGLHFRGGDGWDAEDAGFSGLSLSQTTDVLLQDIEISRVGRTALNLANNNTRLTVQRAHLHDTRDGDGISAGCSDASCFLVDSLIDRAWIHGIGGDRYAISLRHGSQGNSIRDSVIYDVAYRGVYLGSTEFGAENELLANAIWDTGSWAVTVYGAARVRNNVIFGAGEGGIYTADPERGTYEDVVISYNTVVDTADWAVEARDWTTAPSVVLSSNALCNPLGLAASVEREATDTGFSPLADARISNNVMCGLVEGLREDAGEVIAGAGWSDFVNPAGWDLYPSPDSTLIDAGDPESDAWVPPTDFNGASRPGDAPDVGAYEWTGDDNPGWVIQEGFKSLDLRSGPPPEVLGGCCRKRGDAGAADTGAALLLPLTLLVGLRRSRLTGGDPPQAPS